jgi:hypothetical protein
VPYVVYLGNSDAVEQRTQQDGTRTRTPLDGKRCTKVVTPEGMKFVEALTTITHQSLWEAHSNAAGPAWVAANDPTLGRALADHWGCELRDVETETTEC